MLRAPGYPGLDGTPQRTRTVSVSGAAQPIASPAGGTPAVITSIPGLGGVSSRLDTFLSGAATAPGQTALFPSTPVRNGFSIVGAPRVRITVTPGFDARRGAVRRAARPGAGRDVDACPRSSSRRSG